MRAIRTTDRLAPSYSLTAVAARAHTSRCSRSRLVAVALVVAAPCALVGVLAACGGARRPRPSAQGLAERAGTPGASARARRRRGPFDAELLAVGQGFACARTADRRVRCWGNNTAGQLGDGTLYESDVPVPVAGLEGADELAAGALHACAIVAGAVRCWGSNESGELGDGTFAPHRRPAPVPALGGGAAQLALGRAHACAAMDDGAVRCWGRNLNGQLGDGGREDQPAPVTVAGLSGAVRVSAGFEHTCALRADGAVFCWGDNVFGQVGDPRVARTARPLRVAGLPPARELAVAADQSCAVVDVARGADGGGTDGATEVRCWGLRHRDRAPVTRADDPRAEVTELRGTAVAQLAPGVLLSCALRVDRAVRCWGWFDVDEGDPPTSGEASGHRYAWFDGVVPGVRDATRVATGDDHACAMTASGAVLCWGANEFGQLGGARPAVARPRLVTPAVRGVVELAAGAAHSCARTALGEVRCWGRNQFGELGRATATRTSRAPWPVAPLRGAVQLALGGGVSCARIDDGTVRCWGGDGGAWLGDGRPTRVDAAAGAVPVPVQGVAGATQLALGAERACARLADGRARCWGGHPPAPRASANASAAGALVPATDIPGLVDAQEIAVGAAHACVRRPDGTVECLGRNHRGQLGTGTREPSALPAPVVGLAGVVQLAARGDRTCALVTGGRAMCWGANDAGQLGDGTTVDRAAPTAVAGLAGVAQLALGEAHSCARMDDGTVQCWGANDAGQLGLEGAAAASVAWREVPAPVPGLAGVVSLALGRDHACALLADGTARCWGANDSDQLGDDRPPASALPVRVRWR